jgi:F-type H+-transporting ATPase subunit b
LTGARRLACALALMALALLAGPAGAQDHGKSAEHTVDIFEGMPALPLGFWSLVTFVILLLVLRRFAWGPMMEGLHKREHGILNAIDEAKKARAEAEQLRQDWQRRMDQAQDEMRGILDDARRKAEHTTDEMIAKARAEIQGERDRLHREIELAKDQALQEIWGQTARLATEVSAKALRRQITIDDQQRLIDEALAELNDRGQEWQQQAGGVRV